MIENMREIIYDALGLAYDLGYANHAAGNMCCLNSDKILNMILDSIELAMMREAVPAPKPVKTVEVEDKDNVEWSSNGCEMCLCHDCMNGYCGEDCAYSGIKEGCEAEHGSYDCISSCPHYEEED